MMPEVSIYYLMAIFRAFLLIIGHKMNVCMIALDKSGINMKCSDGLKPLCGKVKSMDWIHIQSMICHCEYPLGLLHNTAFQHFGMPLTVHNSMH